MDGWCVLRMAAPRTMRVTDSLAAAGFEVWTPVVEQLRRVPRSKKFRTVQVPLLPTFAFSRYMDVPLLLAAINDPVAKHPPFRVFRHGDSFPKILDVQLEALREVERKAAELANVQARRLRPVPLFEQDQPVHAPESAFAGLEGKVVKGAKGKAGLVLVLFEGMSIPVQIASWRLESARGSDPSPSNGAAAKAA